MLTKEAAPGFTPRLQALANGMRKAVHPGAAYTVGRAVGGTAALGATGGIGYALGRRAVAKRKKEAATFDFGLVKTARTWEEEKAHDLPVDRHVRTGAAVGAGLAAASAFLQPYAAKSALKRVAPEAASMLGRPSVANALKSLPLGMLGGAGTGAGVGYLLSDKKKKSTGSAKYIGRHAKTGAKWGGWIVGVPTLGLGAPVGMAAGAEIGGGIGAIKDTIRRHHLRKGGREDN